MSEKEGSITPRARLAQGQPSIVPMEKRPKKKKKRSKIMQAFMDGKRLCVDIDLLIKKQPSSDLSLAGWLYYALTTYQSSRKNCTLLVSILSTKRDQGESVDWRFVDSFQKTIFNLETLFIQRSKKLLKLLETPIGKWKALRRELISLQSSLRKPGFLMSQEVLRVISSIHGCLEFWETLPIEEVLPPGRLYRPNYEAAPSNPIWINDTDSRQFRN